MKIEPRFLRSKVGRRILLLFILCALLPIGGLAVVSFTKSPINSPSKAGSDYEKGANPRGWPSWNDCSCLSSV